MENLKALPVAEFGFPGSLRDQLVAAILDGTKTSTTSLALQYGMEGEPLPTAGPRQVLIDSAGVPVALIEITSIDVVPLGEVPLAHALDEGEGHVTVAQWRSAHEDFWHGKQFREAMGNPRFAVDDATLVILERFSVVGTIPGGN